MGVPATPGEARQARRRAGGILALLAAVASSSASAIAQDLDAIRRAATPDPAICRGPTPERDRNTNTKVTGGWSACQRNWPGMAALRLIHDAPDSDGERKAAYFCGGVMIAPQWLLTAAHCLNWFSKGSPRLRFEEVAYFAARGLSGAAKLQVVVGVDNLARVDEQKHVFDVVEPAPLPAYLQQRGRLPDSRDCGLGKCAALVGKDIALVRIEGRYAGPLARIAADEDADDLPESIKPVFMIAGFGETDPKKPSSPAALAMRSIAGVRPAEGPASATEFVRQGQDRISFFAPSAVLKETAVPLVPRKVCREGYERRGAGARYNIGEDQICASDVAITDEEQPRDTCQGDSGGPLMAYDRNGCPYVVGVTSWGIGCGNAALSWHGVYTRVSRFYHDFIEARLGPDLAAVIALPETARFDRAQHREIVQAVARLRHLWTSSKNGSARLRINFCAGGRPGGCARHASPRYKAADGQMAFQVTARGEIGALIVLVARPDGRIEQLFPTPAGGSNPIAAHSIVLPPEKSAAGFLAPRDLDGAELIFVRLAASAYGENSDVRRLVEATAGLAAKTFTRLTCHNDRGEEMVSQPIAEHIPEDPAGYLRAIAAALSGDSSGHAIRFIKLDFRSP